MTIDEELTIRLLKQRVPLLVQHTKLKEEVRLKRKELYNIAWKMKELDDEILLRTRK